MSFYSFWHLADSHLALVVNNQYFCKQIISAPDHQDNSGFDGIRIHNTGTKPKLFSYLMSRNSPIFSETGGEVDSVWPPITGRKWW